MWWWLLLLFVVVVVVVKREKYQPGDYHRMAVLPYALPPTGIGALGEVDFEELQKLYPGRMFPVGVVPLACPYGRPRIYETGNALNPNTTSVYGVVTADEVS